MSRRGARAGGVTALVALLLVAMWPAFAAAQSTSAAALVPSQIRSIDGRDLKAVKMTFLALENESAAQGAKVGENGKAVDAKVAPLENSEISTIFVIDNSTVMSVPGALDAAKRAMAAYAEKSTGQLVGVVTVGRTSKIALNPVTATQFSNAAQDIGVAVGEDKGKAALWDGVYEASRTLALNESRQGNIIVIAGASDSTSEVDVAAARARMASEGHALFVVGYANDQLPAQALEKSVDITGGAMTTTGKVEDIEKVVSSYADAIGSQFTATWTSTKTEGLVDVQMRIGKTELSASYPANGIARGKLALTPTPAGGSTGIAFLQGSLGLYLAVAGVAAGVALGAYILGVTFGSQSELSEALQVYTEGYIPDSDDEDGSLLKTAFVQRAVDITQEIAERQGFLSKIETMLEQASLPLRAAEALVFYLAGVAGLLVLGIVVTGSLMGGVVLMIIGALVPPSVMNFIAARRRKQFVAMLPDTLQLLAGTLRAGFSLMQGVEAVAQEVSEPMGTELRRVVTEARLGRPLEDALTSTADRMSSPDFAWAVMAINIQREVGGNLAELLLTVADTMVQRERLRGEIAALTAEGKISAMVLALLPTGLGLTLYTINRPYMENLLQNTLGNILLGVSIFMAFIGFAWMRKIIRIDI